jgi:hypothetical protein
VRARVRVRAAYARAGGIRAASTLSVPFSREKERARIAMQSSTTPIDSRDTARPAHARFRRLATVQSAVYLATGAWPLISRRTFEAVTGPKVDFWLVRAVGGLLVVVGGVLADAARRPPSREAAVLGAGAAGVLGLVSATHALRGRISKVYLLDALMELGLAASWLGVVARGLDDTRGSR